MPYPIYLIYVVVAGLMGGTAVAIGAYGLWRTVQPMRLTLSQRLLVFPVSLFFIVAGSMMVLVSIDQEGVAKTLALPLFGCIGLLLAIGGPWLAVRSETPFQTRVAGVIVTPFGIWILLGTAGYLIELAAP